MWPPNFILMVKLRNRFKAFELRIQVERKTIPQQCSWIYQQLVHANCQFSQHTQCLFQFEAQCEVAIWPHTETPNPKLHPLQLYSADYVSLSWQSKNTYVLFFLSSSRSTLDIKLHFRAGRCEWPISFRAAAKVEDASTNTLSYCTYIWLLYVVDMKKGFWKRPTTTINVLDVY